jgi:chemotaxis protein CheC
MHTPISSLALDALGEVSNIGSGHAATALSQLVGKTVELDVPRALMVPLPYASEEIGPAELRVVAILTGVHGSIAARVLLVFDLADARDLCSLIGVDLDGELGMSAMQEIGNILTSSYVGAIGQFTGLELLPEPPLTAVDMLAAVMDDTLALAATETNDVFLFQTQIRVDGKRPAFAFLFVPLVGGVDGLLEPLGLLP